MTNSKKSLAPHYHQRTKYDPNTIAAKNRSLDWDNQPSTNKKYRISLNVFELKPYLSDNLDLSVDPDLNLREWKRLSQLLFYSYGITAKINTAYGEPIYLRSAPSAGGLYPAEVYLISRGTKILPPGLYNYQVPTHSLVHFWDSDVWQDLQTACFDRLALANTELAIAVTSVFYRSVWRYEDRAYRRILLDTGHLLGNIELAGALNNYRPHAIGGFNDEAMNSLLYLDPELEATLAIAAIADLEDPEQDLPRSITALPSEIVTDYPAIPDGELLSYFHRASQIKSLKSPNSSVELNSEKGIEDKYNFPFCLKIATPTNPIDWEENLFGLKRTILKRRSTRAYSGKNLTMAELKALLHFTYQSQDYVYQGLDDSPDYFDLSLIETFVAVSGVEDLEAGCYYYAPEAEELRQVRFKNFRKELHFLCLGQNLGKDAAAIVFHTADLEQAVRKYGDRAYRYLHLDAGHLGQRLNLAAIYLGLGVSGIGGFFDDLVNEVLGIPEREAVIYITTLGRPRSR
ncbi:MAG: SagB/ThcOx family dehydrogenase [Prochloraceae cyanobacterium]|nr:SagB/ThcOx family dehydrogenase [Prochloraceae cyanobacterium]